MFDTALRHPVNGRGDALFSGPDDAGCAAGGAPPVVVVVLAAGLSRRFGGDKLAARLADGRAVGATSLAAACAAWPQVLCVVRPGTAMAQIAADAGVHCIECPEAVEGMGRSLAAGVRAAAGAGGWVIALADMPHVRPATIRQVAERVAAGRSIVAPGWRGERGHPVGFPGDLGAELIALTGDQGAREVLARHRERLQVLAVDDPGILRDIDRPADLVATE